VTIAVHTAAPDRRTGSASSNEDDVDVVNHQVEYCAVADLAFRRWTEPFRRDADDRQIVN